MKRECSTFSSSKRRGSMLFIAGHAVFGKGQKKEAKG